MSDVSSDTAALPQTATPIATYEYKAFTFSNNVIPLLVAIIMFSIVLSGGATGLGAIVAGVFGAAALFTEIYFLRELQRNKGKKISLYPDGIIENKNGETQTIRWNDIKEIEVSFPNAKLDERVPSSYKLLLGDGSSLTYDNSIRSHAALGKSILEHAADDRLPAILKKLEDGGMFAIDNIGITREGVSKGREVTIPWEDVQQIKVQHGPSELGINFTVTRKSDPKPIVISNAGARFMLSNLICEKLIKHYGALFEA